jgi:N-acetylmuramoyl-L-alanine amidase
VSPAKALLNCLILFQAFSPPRPVLGAASTDFVVYDKQTKRLLPKVRIENHDYLTLVDFLQILDLPYSESASSGFITIGVGKSTIKLTKDRSVAQVNEATVALSAPVVVAQERWLVSPDFIGRVLNRVLPEKVTVSASGNRFLLGSGVFNRLDIKGFASEQNSTVVVQMSAPVEAEIRREDSKITLTFGNAPLDPAREDYQYKDTFVESIHFEESSSSHLVVIDLVDKALQAKVTHLASQNAYLLELTRPSPAPNPEREESPPSSAVVRPSQEGRKWRHITIDAGHGGEDKGAFIKENLFEKDVTLAVAKKIRWVLQTRLGVDAVLTRADDRTLSLDQRAVAANSAQSDLFLSVHIGNRNRSAEFSSYAYVTRLPPKGTPPEEASVQERTISVQFAPWDQAQANSLKWSKYLAEALQSEMNQKLNGGNASLNFRDAPLKLLSSVAMPAVLVEIGNASQPEWKEMISDSHFQDSLAATVLAALEKFRPSYERP